MSHPNEEALRSAGEAIAKGDFDGFLSHYTDDVVVHYPGTSSLAGEYRGKEAFMGMFARFGEITGGPPEIKVHDTLAKDTHGVVLQTVRIQRKVERWTRNKSSSRTFEMGRSPSCGLRISTSMRSTTSSPE